jgi:transcriptional regulator with XRE-family HTH domain
MNLEAFYAEVGRRIRDARERHGLKQADLATVISRTRTSITNIEQGRQRILLHTLCEIAVALHEEPSVLLPNLDALLGVMPSSSEAEALKHDVSDKLSAKEWKWIRSAITPAEKRG